MIYDQASVRKIQRAESCLFSYLRGMLKKDY